MARLIDWPQGLPSNFREPLSGPRVINAGQSQTIGGFIQTTSAAFGLWRWRFGFPDIIRGRLFRRYRGWITALHGGANATRVPFCDWDGLSRTEMGVTAGATDWKTGQPWSNLEAWSNGQNWGVSPPMAAVASNAAKDDTIVQLGSAFWGQGLGYGDLIGFFPFHLGMYMVTEVVEPGLYRIWPPLRRGISTDDFATLRPQLAMRLESEDGASAARDAAFGVNLSVTLVEVLDYDARDYFTD